MGTVIISMQEYLELQEFKKTVEEDMTMIIRTSFTGNNCISKIPKGEEIEEALDLIKSKDIELIELRKDYEELKCKGSASKLTEDMNKRTGFCGYVKEFFRFNWF